MASPDPIPSAYKIAAGQKTPAAEPKPKPTKNPKAPDWLPAEAKVIWRRLIPQYAAVDLLTGLDLEKFANYCDSQADFIRLTGEIKNEGEVITSFNKVGQPYSQTNPKCNLKHAAWVRMQKLGAEMGDSPSSRARLGKLLDEDEDELGSFLAGKPK